MQKRSQQTSKSMAENALANQSNDQTKTPTVCGIIMPISAIDGCGPEHWSDVIGILSQAIEAAGFTSNLVSNADESGVIQKRIIHNLYANPVVVCDVSCKNPNVMFELGIRLAFDKPTIIVKDDKTDYSFDTSPVEHLTYPRDLRFSRIVEFKQRLAEKIQATSRAESHSFLKSFGDFTTPKLETREVNAEEFLLEELAGMGQHIGEIRSMLHDLRREFARPRVFAGQPVRRSATEVRDQETEEYRRLIHGDQDSIFEWIKTMFRDRLADGARPTEALIRELLFQYFVEKYRIPTNEAHLLAQTTFRSQVRELVATESSNSQLK